MREVRGFVEVIPFRQGEASGFEWRAGFRLDGVDHVLVCGDASTQLEAMSVGMEALGVMGEAAGLPRGSWRVVKRPASEVVQ